MEGRETSHIEKDKITNGWKYDASCMLTSLPVSNLENFKQLIFVAQTVQATRQSSVLNSKVNILILYALNTFLTTMYCEQISC
jgi:hypothetical protein